MDTRVVADPPIDPCARVDPRDELAVAQWAGRLGVSSEELRAAAEQAGPFVRDIRQHLIGGFTGAGPTS